MNDALSIIHARKSVRRYSPEPVSRDALETLLKAAMAAPSAGNHKPWAFVTITKRATLIQLAAGLQYGKMVKDAAAAIVVCGDMDKALPDEERDFWVQDCSAATQNILLAVEAQGLGAVWGGVYPMADRVRMVKSVLGLPETIIPLNIIALGHPAGGEKAKSKYNPACLHWEKW